MKSGFVALMGRPNAGKSTLLNALVNAKVAIVSEKAGTTRDNIRGIYNSDDAQIVFIDTPGIGKPQHLLNARMNKMALSEVDGVDIIYYLVDASIPFGSGDQYLLSLLENTKTPVFLLLNKIDQLNKKALFELIMQWQLRFDFKEIIPVSALDNDNVDTLIQVTLSYLEEGYAYFDREAITDRSTSFQIKEYIREKILYHTQQEVPHSVAVVIDELSKNKNSYHISATIVVERDSQKGILIGNQGKMIKRIGIAARKDMQNLLNKPVFLQLYVRVEKNWRDNPNKLYQLGYLDIDEQ